MADLRDERTRLAALDTGDGGDTDLRMVFSWTYRALDPDAARLFRLLGLHPGPEISAGAAAALIGEDVPAATRLLDRLTADHLLRSRSPGRYDFHDLLRDYAAERAREAESVGDQDAALRRVMEWYVHSARAAARHLPPGERDLPPDSARPGITPSEFADVERAVGWYEEELPDPMAATRHAMARGWHDLAWRLPMVLAPCAEFHAPGPAWVDIFRTAVKACRHTGEAAEEGWALDHLACVHLRMGRLPEAAARFGEALALARRGGDRDLEGQVLAHLGTVRFRLGDYPGSTGCYARALAIARATGDRRLEADTLHNIAQNDNGLGRHAEALEGGLSALGIYTELDDRYHRGEALLTTGVAHIGLGRSDNATGAFRAVLEIMREFEDRRGEAAVLGHLGEALLASGDLDGARSSLLRAVAIFTELDDARAAGVRERLAAIGSRAPEPHLP